MDCIRRSPFLVLSTADARGHQEASPKGDHPGFVIVEDRKTLLIPDRKGNELLFGLQNILANPQVGLLFIVPPNTETLRVNGTAELTVDTSAAGAPGGAGRTGGDRHPPHRSAMLLPLRQGLHPLAVMGA